MRHAAFTLAFFLILSASFVPSAQGDTASVGSALQSAMDEALRDSGAIGVSAAVVFPDGESWAGATGLSHEGVPLTTDMLFDIASAQKNLQAALALELMEEGILALEDPLSRWLPPMPHIDGAITVRQLLNLTSGIDTFVGDPESPFRVGYPNIDFEQIWTWEELQAVFVGEPHFAPGTACEYSTTNYIVLRLLLEKATRSRQATVLEDKVLKPFHLDHTVVDFSRAIPNELQIAHGWFDANDDGLPEDISGNSLNWIISLSPMLVYSTPSDMARWLDALYHRKTVLREETLREMLAFVGPVQGEPLMKGYGLGVVDIQLGALLPRWERIRVYGHLGLQYGYMTFMGYFPQQGVSLAIMSNRGCDGDANRAMLTVGGALIDTLLRSLGAEEVNQGER